MVEPMRDDVMHAIRERFPNQDPAAVLAILDEYGGDRPERERVQLAIIKKVGRHGPLTHLRIAPQSAKEDYASYLKFVDSLPNRADVIAAVQRDFPAEDPKIVLAILDRYGGERWGPERERVQLAILRLSQGDLSKVEAGVELALTDYKEILMLEAERFAKG